MSCCPQPVERSVPAPLDSPAPAKAPVVDHAVPAAMRARSVRVPGGAVRVGTDRPELPQDGEAPAREVSLASFRIDPFTVTTAAFAAFVEATGHVTEAERWGWSFVFVGLLPPDFPPTRAVVSTPWWRQVEGATWRQPEGPGSDVRHRAAHPVTHVSWNDATAFAAWAGGRLPNEAELETAAKGGREQARYPWGEAEPDDEDFQPCNIWQGRFPHEDRGLDGWCGTAPVGSYAANDLGLHDMVGNVWQWAAEPFAPVPRGIRPAAPRPSATPATPPSRVLKGGSYLCHRSYCWRYRIAARMGRPPDTSTGHIGFRVAWDEA